ncbi:class I SAM-dependent methyltransferase [Metabacillus malikii]|uniref:2-polyprenyl-3-methyl-5-hydroxy-6-metoxy-1, 4-benzoquinol methylase n=1 Tax=Metabacillus malikii TaxID=1504265 RepID=A0ABT9ZEM4_9BACI|nr:class I SAM-dependent methyltransferase [Metabacillus malikii]MDQ0230693.1 2-polyprenyl-3-methyl-5-hydroxy-6-metoxy-1,4-benzoquinol methylase [Metabacillus malikii]
MTFYKDLYPFYDRIFPLNKQAEEFLLHYFNEGDAVLDIGAGTGNMAIALAEKKLNITALELEPLMIEAIQQKAKSKDITIDCVNCSMMDISNMNKMFNGIYCIGNTLPHLQTVQEIKAFLQECYEKLNDNGNFIIQMVNFDKFASKADFSFPLINQADFSFRRKYEWTEDKILFTATLSFEGKETTNHTTLFPLQSQQLVQMLKEAGFNNVRLFGNFKANPYTVESPAIVTVAMK